MFGKDNVEKSKVSDGKDLQIKINVGMGEIMCISYSEYSQLMHINKYRMEFNFLDNVLTKRVCMFVGVPSLALLTEILSNWNSYHY